MRNICIQYTRTYNLTFTSQCVILLARIGVFRIYLREGGMTKIVFLPPLEMHEDRYTINLL